MGGWGVGAEEGVGVLKRTRMKAKIRLLWYRVLDGIAPVEAKVRARLTPRSWTVQHRKQDLEKQRCQCAR